jgi:hypothetical protein
MPTGTFKAWTLRLLIVASTTILVGLIWDVSWHMTIGRDTFWTPAHLFIYVGAAVSGCVCGALAIKTTFFSGPEDRSASTTIWGGRAPLGAWIAIWGAIAMIASGPFDDWWHNAYGLDVKIISPPHILLFSGMISIVMGALILAQHQQNQPLLVSGNETQKPANTWASPYVVGVAITFLSILFFSEGYPNRQHSSEYYFLYSCVMPLALVAIAQASKAPWAASKAALSYMAIELAMLWILPRFSATPKLGPVLHTVDHMVPPYFPHLLIVPALGIDLVKNFGRARNVKPMILIPLCAGIFVVLFVSTQWNFSEFLMSAAANNAFFVGGQSFPYYAAHMERSEIYWQPDRLLALHPLIKIFGASLLSTAAGWVAGNWLRKVKR